MTRRWTPLGCLVMALLVGAARTAAGVIGTNESAEPLSLDRIERLPGAEQAPWREYFQRSLQQGRADRQALQRELEDEGLAESVLPPSSRGVRSMPLGRPAGWYAEPEALHIADIIVSFQTPAGGWSKNLDLSRHTRRPGEGFAPDNSSRYVGTDDHDELQNLRWSYVGTIDNGATTAELRFLAKVISALPVEKREPYRAAFLRGVKYLLSAQYPNGGWPQVWPLQGGYHDAITYNDGAMVSVLELLRDLAEVRDDFRFVPARLREPCGDSVRRGVDCLLATQVIVDGQRTAWCQQHDPLTLAPCAARNYEMPSLCSAESAAIAGYLMELPGPDSNVVAAVEAAVAWLEQTRLEEVAFRAVGQQGRLLVPAPGGGPLWSRYYEIGSNRPIFGERDKTIHDRVEDISRERRQGYAWFTDGPNELLQRFKGWSPPRVGVPHGANGD